MADLQKATLEEEWWSAVARRVDEAVGGIANHLAVVKRRGGSLDILVSLLRLHGEPDPEIERRYVEECAFRDERLDRLDAWPNGRLLHNTEVYTPSEQRTSFVYRSFLPSVGSNNQVNVRMNGLDGTEILWVVTARPDGDWSSEQLRIVERLLPHVRHFVRVRQALAAAEARESSLTGLLDRSGLSVLHLDRAGRVLEANAPAQELLAAGDCLLQRDRQLRTRGPHADAKLGRLLSACCRKGLGGSMTLHPRGGSAASGPLLLFACPVPPDRTSFDSRGVAAQVIVASPDRAPGVDSRPLAGLYDLTPTESRVAALLAEGLSVREIAASTGRGESTVRWHVKNLHSKLGVHRQADLIRVVQATAAAAPAE